MINTILTIFGLDCPKLTCISQKIIAKW